MIFFGLAVLIATVSTVYSSSCQGEVQWPFYGGNSAHSGFVAEEIRDSHTPKLIFSTTLTSSSISYVTSCNGYIFAVSPAQGNLAVLSTKDGSLVKNLFLGASSSMGPATCVNNRVYVNSVGVNEGLYVHHFDLDTFEAGKTVVAGAQWPRYNFGLSGLPPNKGDLIYTPGGTYNGEIIGFDSLGNISFDSNFAKSGFAADSWAPAVYKGRVFVNNGQGEGNPGMIGEVSPTDGTLLWKFEVPSSTVYSTNWVPVIARFVYFFVSINGGNLEYGAIPINTPTSALWGFPCTAPKLHGDILDYSPSTDGFSVFLTCADGIYELDGWDGTKKNFYPCDDCYGKTIVTGDSLIVSSAKSTKILSRCDQSVWAEIPATGFIAVAGYPMNILVSGKNGTSTFVNAYSL